MTVDDLTVDDLTVISRYLGMEMVSYNSHSVIKSIKKQEIQVEKMTMITELVSLALYRISLKSK